MDPNEAELRAAWTTVVREWKFPIWPQPSVICDAIKEYRQNHRAPALPPPPKHPTQGQIDARRRRVFSHPIARDLLFTGAGKALAEEFIDTGKVPDGRHISPQIEAHCRRSYADFLRAWETLKADPNLPGRADLLSLAEGMMNTNRQLIADYGGEQQRAA